MIITRQDRNQTFDNKGNLIAEEVVEVDITTEVVTLDLHTKVRAAVTANRTALDQIPAAIASMQTIIDGTAANLTQANVALDTIATTVKRLLNSYENTLRQLTGIERLLIGSDLLNDTDGT